MAAEARFGQGTHPFPEGTDYDAGTISALGGALVNGWTVQTKGSITRKGQDVVSRGPWEQDTHFTGPGWGPRREFSGLGHEPLGPGVVGQPGHPGIVF